MAVENIVIVGGGLAGATAAKTLRAEGFSGPRGAGGRRVPPAVPAPAAVQGVPAGQGRRRRPAGGARGLVRRERRRPPARRPGHGSGPGCPGRGSGRRRAAGVRLPAARHGSAAQDHPPARQRARRRQHVPDGGGQPAPARPPRRRRPERGHDRVRLDRDGTGRRRQHLRKHRHPAGAGGGAAGRGDRPGPGRLLPRAARGPRRAVPASGVRCRDSGAVGTGDRGGHRRRRGPARRPRGHRRGRGAGARPGRGGRHRDPQRHPHRRVAADLGARDLRRRRRRQCPAPVHRGAPPQRALVQCPEWRQGGRQGDARPRRRAGHHPVLLHGPVRRQHGVLGLPDARCRATGHPRLACGQGVHCLLAARAAGWSPE